jgi:hypothetical protein
MRCMPGRVALRLEEYVEYARRPGDVSVVILGGRAPMRENAEYDGCFLQREDSLATTDGGVLCLCNRAGATFRQGDAPLWDAVHRVAAELERVRTGNCPFSPADWQRYVTTGLLPPVTRLRGAQRKLESTWDGPQIA